MKNKVQIKIYLKQKWMGIIIVIMVVFFGFFFAEFALGIPVLEIPNPAAVYCKELGYEFTINKTEDGEIGICKFPDGSSVNAWDFLEGKSGAEYSYCKQRGYELKIVSDSRCSYAKECVICVLENGEEIEVTKLMGLDEKILSTIPTMKDCGNDICEKEKGESYQNCPQDCPSPEFLAERRTKIFTGIGIFLFIAALFLLYWLYFRKILAKRKK